MNIKEAMEKYPSHADLGRRLHEILGRDRAIEFVLHDKRIVQLSKAVDMGIPFSIRIDTDGSVHIDGIDSTNKVG